MSVSGTSNETQQPRLLCRKCDSPVTEADKDGAGTQLYQCSKCGLINNPKEETKQATITEPESLDDDDAARLIGDPFETKFDVTDDNPVEDIPPDMKQKLVDEDSVRDKATSDVPFELPQEPNPAREAFLKKVAEQSKLPDYPDFLEFTRNSDDKPIPFRPAKVATWLHENSYFLYDRATKQLYFGDVTTGTWKPNGETYLEEILTVILGEHNLKTHYTNILHALKGLSYTDIKFGKKFRVKNGLLDLDAGELTEPNLGEMTCYSLPVKYDPEAKCPIILEKLTEIIGEQQLPLLLEAIGNIFIIGMLFQKITIFIGGGGNGKGQVLDLIQALVGKENVSYVTLQALCSDKYERATAYRKLVNLGRDLPQTRITATGNAKMMSGDDPMTMQHKYGHPFVAYPDDLPKQFYSCNQLPPSDDDTDAWYRRQNLITFNKKFEAGVNAIPRLAEKLAQNEEEMSGFLNLVLAARKRLLENGGFSANENIEENRERYIKNSNPSQAYIEANLTYEQNKFIPEKELWSKVGLWCQEKSIAAPKNKGEFTKELTRLIPQVQQTSQRVEGKSIHVYMNVTYKEPAEGQTPVKGQTQLMDDSKTKKPESVTTVTTVTTSPNHLFKSDSLINKKYIGQAVTPVTVVTNQEVMHYQRVNPHVESHKCDNCKGLLAEFKQKTETGWVYLCSDCFKGARANAEGQVVKLIEDPPDEQREFTDNNPRSEEAF